MLKRTGSHGWVNGKDKALDYVVRITAYAGKSHVRVTYSIVNRQGERMSDFVRLDGLRLEARLEKTAAPARIEQLSAEPRRTGWFEAGGIGFGLRWFWQLYPKAFEVRSDGRVRLELFPETARPQNIYMGVAKTHEMILSFGGENLSAHLDDPLYAVAPPKWYTRETGALGRLVESSAEAIQPQYWPLVERYDRWLAASRDAVLAKRDRGVQFEGRTLDEYGMLNFGDAVHKIITDNRKLDYGIHWETEYYDFPHALFLHFFRTGDLVSLRTAVEASAHLADVDISHYDVEPTLHGAPRTGPGLNHWTRYSNGEFIASASWAFYKNESLFDRYLLTGDLWSRDVARLVGRRRRHEQRSRYSEQHALDRPWPVRDDEGVRGVRRQEIPRSRQLDRRLRAELAGWQRRETARAEVRRAVGPAVSRRVQRPVVDVRDRDWRRWRRRPGLSIVRRCPRTCAARPTGFSPIRRNGTRSGASSSTRRFIP